MHTITTWTGKPFPRKDVLLHVGEGWRPLVDHLIDDLFELGWNGHLHQIKEKFGGLRFYTGDISKECADRISQAEHDSYETCEKCGMPGTIRGGGWLKCLCDSCNETRK